MWYSLYYVTVCYLFQVNIYFTEFSTEECCDFLKIYSQASIDGKKILISQRSGGIDQTPIAGTNLTLEFRSNNATNMKGFSGFIGPAGKIVLLLPFL